MALSATIVIQDDGNDGVDATLEFSESVDMTLPVEEWPLVQYLALTAITAIDEAPGTATDSFTTRSGNDA